MSALRNLMPWLVLFFALAFDASSAMAATETSPWFYRAWQTEEGLPDNSITGVAQTGDGYLWVATKGGLGLFNGQSFSVVPGANFPAVPSRAVRALFRDRNDHLWLGMERGPLLCLKPEGLQRFTPKDGLPSLRQRVLMMAEDKEGAVWVVYPSYLRRILKGRVESISLPAAWSQPAGLLATSDGRGNIWCAKGADFGVWRDRSWQSLTRLPSPITAICSGSESSIWIGTGNGVFKFQEGHDPVKVGRLPAKAMPRVLLEDKVGALWIGTDSDGLFRWEGREFERVPTSQLEITSLLEDREGDILAGTAGGGLNLIRQQTVTLTGREGGLPFESVLSVSEDTEGYLWAAGQDGQLARAKDGPWELMSSATNWPGGKATCVAADQSGGVWVGTGDRGLKYFRDGVWRGWSRRDGLAGYGVRSLLVASNGDVWVGVLFPYQLQRLRAGKIQNITNAANVGRIRALSEGPDGTIWVGTAEGDIRRVRDLTLIAEPAINEVENLSVRSLLATEDGSLWIGYAGDGLGHLRNGEYRRLTTDAGLADDFISQLLPDRNGNLWITGNRGLWRVSISELESVLGKHARRVSMRTYGSADSLLGLQPNRDNCPSAWPGRDGRLWFSTRSGLLSVDAQKIRDNPYPPLVQLEQVRLDDRLIAIYNARSPLQTQLGTNLINLRGMTIPLHLGPNHRKLEIDFAALSFTSPENVQFRYRLSGFDADWIDVGPHRSAIYPRLRAGDYRFQVLACNNTGIWNETGATLDFSVSPFFWETWWFKVGGGLFTALLAGGIAFLVSRRRYHRRLRRSEARRALEQERTRIARDIHDEMGSSLTRILMLSQPDGDSVAASSPEITRINETARNLTRTMDEVVWAVNPRHDTLESVCNYLSAFAQEFAEAAHVTCRLAFPERIPAVTLSAEARHNLFLAAKEAIHNAVRHGHAQAINVSLKLKPGGFTLEITDNGIGFNPGAPTGGRRGHGLDNMQERLTAIGGTCEIFSRPGSGATVRFTVTLLPAGGSEN